MLVPRVTLPPDSPKTALVDIKTRGKYIDV
jgi:hypothetical protein